MSSEPSSSTAPHSAKEASEGFKAGEPDGNTKKGLTTGAPNAHLSGRSVIGTLQKPGYQPRTVEVKFSGRTPLVRHEKLILDSGILEIRSEPAGAAVSVNGIPRGETPVTVRGVPKGAATVVLQKSGYGAVVRELALNAGDTQTLFLKLEGLPGALKLSSVPCAPVVLALSMA
jgi:hypothetical protein